MTNDNFTPDTINGDRVFYLQGGTKYLPTLYIKRNKNWNKWMVFDSKNHDAITNRTFATKSDCIEFVTTYDEQTNTTLDVLYPNIQDQMIKEIIKQIDFTNPKPLFKMPKKLRERIHNQSQEIANAFNKYSDELLLITSFFDGYLSLFANDADTQDELEFYIVHNGKVSKYASWKIISLLISLTNKINEYLEETQSPSDNVFKGGEPDIDFKKESFNGNKILRLDGGTKYLPSIYIKKNQHWNKWMVYDTKNHQAITNRTFLSKSDCIDFISSYDEQSEKTITNLLHSIENKNIRELISHINFSNPRPLKNIRNQEAKKIIDSQKGNISAKYHINKQNIQLICYFFDGMLSLYTNGSANHDDLVFYIFDNGNISSYSSWKSISVIMALSKKLLEYEKEKVTYEHLEGLVGRSLVDQKGNGFHFIKYIPETSLMYVEKVHVKMVDGIKIADSESSLVPPFIAQLEILKGKLILYVKNHFLDAANNNEVYSFEIVG